MIQQATIYITQTDRESLYYLIELARERDDRANLPYVGKLGDQYYAVSSGCICNTY